MLLCVDVCVFVCRRVSLFAVALRVVVRFVCVAGLSCFVVLCSDVLCVVV